jgi:hypothetical protein
MTRYSFERFLLKAVFAVCVILLTSFSSPLCAADYNISNDFSSATNLNSVTSFTGLDITATANIRMIFNNDSLLDKMVGSGSDSDSLINQVTTTKKGKMPDYVADKSCSSPLCAAAYNASNDFSSATNLNSVTKFTGLDITTTADIRMIFNNASLPAEMNGGSSDSESFTNQVVIAKARILNFVTSDKGSPSIKKHRCDNVIQAGVLVTPEPATILILGMGSLVLIRKSRSQA